jgi:hypothetical protein
MPRALRPHFRRLLGTACGMLLAVIAPSVQAQVVRGTVVQPDGTTPAAAVLVELLDSGGIARARTTTSLAGLFQLRAPQPGRFVVRALRIGFRPSASGPLDVGPSGAEVRITLGADRVALEAIQVRGRTPCRAAGAGGVELALVWDEARKALAYAALTAAERRHRLIVATFERELEGDGAIVRREVVRSAETTEARAFRSVGIDTLLRDGFVVQQGRELHFFGPDADVLLSDAFVAAHCLRLVPDPHGDSTRIAIAFEPAERRDVIGVRGTLSLTRATGELQQLVFGYVGLPDEAAAAGGALTFARVDDGGWVVLRWELRMPVLDVEVAGDDAPQPDRVAVRQLRATGGEVLEITHGDATLYRAPLRRVSGRVVRDAGATPVAGAQVTLQGTTHATRTDASGAFTLDDVLPARYRLVARTALLDSLGGVAPGGVIDLVEGDVTGRTIDVPDAEAMYRTLCRVERDDRRGALLRVTVRHAATGEGIAGAGVQLRWGGIERDGRVLGRQQERALVTEADGTIAWCGAPRGVVIRLRVTAGDAASPEQQLTISPLRPYAAREVTITPR